MIQIIKRAIKTTPLYHLLRNWRMKRGQMKEIVEWEAKRRPAPPPHIIKQQILLDYAKKYNLKVLVETGTYYGDMVEAMKDSFDRVYSIELSKELFDKNIKRFRKTRNIELIHGNSGIELRKIMNKISQAALFWLDGHYSGGETSGGEKSTPIYEELNHIFSGSNRGHVIIIDDARCFGTDPTYPTLAELKEFIKSKNENVEIFVQNDSIRITPISSIRP